MRKTWVKRDNIYYKPFYKQKLKMTLLGVLVMAIVFFGYQFFYISQLSSTAASGTSVLVRSETTEQQQPDSRNTNNLHRVNSIGNVVEDDAAGAGPALEAAAKVRDEGGGGAGALGGVSNGSILHGGDPSGDSRYVYVEKVGNYEKKILRGIRLRDLEAYSVRPATLFRCLASQREIGWDRVNDDYCDCPEDGSDEPSTNACARGRFYCRFQRRHLTGRGGYASIPSAWINDGVCDCCDGSDEWLRQPPNSCRDTCKEKYSY